ncbi:MAG: zinc ribbon domain-containing protein [Candidatus Nitrosocaldus sp.]
MGQLGYNTRGPLVDKLKNLLNDVQGSYEAFLDAHTLYQEGRIDERAYFTRMGDFLRQFSSLGFLMVKVILELDASIGREKQQREARQVAATATAAMVKPSPSIEQFTQQVAQRTPQSLVKEAQQKDTKQCVYCGATIPSRAKFCPKCGKQQSEEVNDEGRSADAAVQTKEETGKEKEEEAKKEKKRRGSSARRSRKIT